MAWLTYTFSRYETTPFPYIFMKITPLKHSWTHPQQLLTMLNSKSIHTGASRFEEYKKYRIKIFRAAANVISRAVTLSHLCLNECNAPTLLQNNWGSNFYRVSVFPSCYMLHKKSTRMATMLILLWRGGHDFCRKRMWSLEGRNSGGDN